jgi:outer membrane receptor protein involved in Fe transport
MAVLVYGPRVIRRLRAALLALLLGATPAAAQQAEPPQIDPVVVTATRMEQRVDEAPASVTVITREDIRQSASQTVDDLLRQVPGFSLFRRASSVVTHPTTQGTSLRGIGPSGASRVTVLVDGVPANDPFGGWVYWSRMPLQSIDQIEVVRGGGSSVWGNGALGGVINVITRKPMERAAYFSGWYGGYDSYDLDLLVTEVVGPFRLSVEGDRYSTDGYKIVKHSRRGSIDVDAASEHTTLNGRVELVLSPDVSLFATGTYFDEERDNGTPLQFNRTGTGAFSFGGRVRDGDSEWTFTLFGDLQEFRSTFSTQAADRNSETLALDQRVPTTSAGGALQWTHRLGAHRLGAGGDLRWVHGETRERVYNAGAFVRDRVAGGQQIIGGVYVEDVWIPHRIVEVSGGVRLDYWLSYDAQRRDTPPAAGSGVPAFHAFGDIERLIPSPRLAALIHATPTTDVRLSAYQGFRVPTLNELYRAFRVRNDVTAANEHLRPERLTGGEAGVQQRWGPLTARTTGYWNDVKDIIINATQTIRLPDCPAGTLCRQRENIDLARIRGLETEVELRPARDWRLIASHLFTDAEVVEATRQPALEGKRLAQVPENTATLTVRYDNPVLFAAGVTLRYVGSQFEDDLNTLPLGSYVTLDATISRAFAKWGEVFLAGENLFNRTYAVGRTSEGVISTGAPRLVRGGIRLAF